MGDRARPRRAGARRRRRTGSGTAPTCLQPELRALPRSRCRAAAPTPTWSASSTSTTKAFVKDGFALPEAKSQRRLDRPRHALRRHRLRPGLADRSRATRASSRSGSAARRSPRRRRSSRASRRRARSARHGDLTPGFERDFVTRAHRPSTTARRSSAATASSSRSTSPTTPTASVAPRMAAAHAAHATGRSAARPTRPARCSRPTSTASSRASASFDVLFEPTERDVAGRLLAHPAPPHPERARQRPQPSSTC